MDRIGRQSNAFWFLEMAINGNRGSCRNVIWKTCVKPQGRIPLVLKETGVEPHQWGRTCFQAWLFFLLVNKANESLQRSVSPLSQGYLLLAWFYFIINAGGRIAPFFKIKTWLFGLPYLLPGHRYLKLYCLSDNILGLWHRRTSRKLCSGAIQVKDFGKEIKQTSQ